MYDQRLLRIDQLGHKKGLEMRLITNFLEKNEGQNKKRGNKIWYDRKDC